MLLDLGHDFGGWRMPGHELLLDLDVILVVGHMRFFLLLVCSHLSRQ